MKRKFFGIMTLAVFFLAVTHAYAGDLVTWKFVKVEKNPFCEKADIDPDAIYSYDMSAEGSDWVVSSGMAYEEVKYLLALFGVKTPGELKGRTFKSQKTDASMAVDYLILMQKHGGNYTPPSDEQLYEQTALAMSKMECPDFSDVDRETVFHAFLKAWQGFSAEKDWMQNLKNRISELSEGKVKLVEGDYEKFPVRVKGPADYLLLIKGEKSIMVIMGPYSTPVSFH